MEKPASLRAFAIKEPSDIVSGPKGKMLLRMKP